MMCCIVVAQLVKMVKILGTPTKDDVRAMNSHYEAQAAKACSHHI